MELALLLQEGKAMRHDMELEYLRCFLVIAFWALVGGFWLLFGVVNDDSDRYTHHCEDYIAG